MMNLSLIHQQPLHSPQPHGGMAPPCLSSGISQPALLARLADISHRDDGWILFANTPGRPSRHSLATAGINPARIIDAGPLSQRQLRQALASNAIAVVVCWHLQDGTFFEQRQLHPRLFVIGPSVPAGPLH